MPDNPNKLSQFWQELKRRKVVKLIAVYAATAYIIFEVVDIVLPRLGLPDWTVTFIIVLVIAGFPITVILSWIFDVTPQGIKKTEPIHIIKKREPLPPPAKRKLKSSDGIIAVLVVVVVILAYPRVFRSEGDLFRKAYEGKKSIAIFPFTNHTGDSTYNHLEFGISELLINALSSSQEIVVLDNQTISNVIDHIEHIQKAAIGPDVAREAAKRIRVESYITGDFMQAGSTFRINLKLIDTQSSKVLTTEFVEGAPDSVFSMVGALSNSIKNHLEIEVLGESTGIELADYVTTSSPEAYRYYIKGLEKWWHGKGGIQELQEAIRLDSTFTEANLYLSIIYSRHAHYDRARETFVKANLGKERLSRKMQLWLEAFKAQYIDKNPYRSIQLFEEVSEIEPLSRLNWFWLGDSYRIIEEYEDAQLAFEQILRLNNKLGQWDAPRFYYFLGWTYKELGEYKKAQKILKNGADLFPESTGIRFSQAACALLQQDTVSAHRYIDEYKTELRKTGYFPDPSITAYVGHIYYQGAGLKQKGTEIYRQALDMRLKAGRDIDTVNPGNNLFWYYGILGNVYVADSIDIEQGMEYLNRAMELSKVAYSPSGHPWVLIGLGVGYYRQGKLEEAHQILKQAEQEATEYRHRLHRYIQEVEEAMANQAQ